MKVLQITETADTGGAEVCARMLHEGLLHAGHDAHILVGHTTRADDRIRVMQRQSLLSRFCYHGLNMFGLNYLGILNAGAVLRHPFFAAADVVHLHNIHGGYFNYLNLVRLSALRPVVWTLHDMWPLTGHCAHSFDCTRWRTGCGRCPYPGTYPPVRVDATRLDHRVKRWVYARSKMALICPSRWLTQLTRQSTLSRFPVRHVPNAVDTEVFAPRDRGLCRAELGIPRSKLVLLASVAGFDNPFKDQALLIAALEKLDPRSKDRTVLVTMGRDEPAGSQCAGLPLIRLGYLVDDKHKAAAYNAADVFLYPTRADNQPLALLEAMACGCPAVSSEVGGVPEIVRNQATGCLAPTGEAGVFAQAVEYLLSDESARGRMSANCRQMILDRHALPDHVSKTIGIYATTIRAWRAERA